MWKNHVTVFSKVIQATASSLLLKTYDDVALVIQLFEKRYRRVDMNIGSSLRWQDVLDDLNDVLRVPREHSGINDMRSR